VIDKTAQHLDHGARGFTRLDHVSIKRLERLGVVPDSLRKSLTVHNPVGEILAYKPLRRTFITLICQCTKSLAKRHASLQKISKLTREKENVGLLHHGLFALLCGRFSPSSGCRSCHTLCYA